MDTASVEAALRLRAGVRSRAALERAACSRSCRPSRSTPTASTGPRSGTARDRRRRRRAGGAALRLSFRTLAPGLERHAARAGRRQRRDRPDSPIAVFFDGPIDPDSVTADDLLTITPAGGRIAERRRRRPATSRPSRTTPPCCASRPPARCRQRRRSRSRLRHPVTSLRRRPGGARVAGRSRPAHRCRRCRTRSCSSPTAAASADLWAMNPDGSAPRQLSTELAPSSTTRSRPTAARSWSATVAAWCSPTHPGADRRVLTEEGSSSSTRPTRRTASGIAFARADAETGEGLGLWERGRRWWLGDPDRAGRATRRHRRAGSSADDEPPPRWLRAPRYAPDGSALAYVDLAGAIGIVDSPPARSVRAPTTSLGSAGLAARRGSLSCSPAGRWRRAHRARVRGARRAARADRRRTRSQSSTHRARDARSRAALGARRPRRRRRAGRAHRVSCAAIGCCGSPTTPTTPGARRRALVDEQAWRPPTFAPGEDAIAVVIRGRGRRLTSPRARIERVDLDGRGSGRS